MKERKKIGYLISISSLLVIVFTLVSAVSVAPGAESAGLAEIQPSIEPTTDFLDESITVGYPSRLVIPKLKIDAKVLHLGITSGGNMAVPGNFDDVGWYKYGAKPGERGSAVIAGHEDDALSLDGVFKHLEDLEKGDSVYVEGENGEVLRFEVVGKQIYPYNLIGPELERIFHDDSGKYLNLITCAGNWLKEARTNDLRLIVFTRLAD